ncbi:MAG: glycosyltransferase [Proteobacteria bacterium]|nr:glycosyltransferase [Pseudomonadota bacterium]
MKAEWGLYWDGYGLDAPNSGVFVHAANLSAELIGLGVLPVLVGKPAALANFPGLEGVAPAPGALSRFLPDNKISWCADVARAISKRTSRDGAPFIIHGLSNFNVPAGTLARCRRVLTIHDLIPLLAPDQVSKALVWQLKYLLPRAVAAADRVVCVSNWTYQTLVSFIPGAAAKARVISNGVFRQASFPRRTTKRQRNQSIELLFVARFEPYKGHSWLLKWLNESTLPLKLTLITDAGGEEFWNRHGSQLIAKGSVVLKRSVFGDALRAAYEAADIYVSPSRFEGFCLPAVEALSAGIPVVYHPGSGIDEVAGRSVSVPVDDTKSVLSWDKAVEEALGRSQREGFPKMLADHLSSLPTWKDAAIQLLSLYNELV